VIPGRCRAERELLAEHEVGTFGGEWHPAFGLRDGDVVASEHWDEGGFAHTDLDQQLDSMASTTSSWPG
jgi:hypothetical protein